jgi:hypothetical protein
VVPLIEVPVVRRAHADADTGCCKTLEYVSPCPGTW